MKETHNIPSRTFEQQLDLLGESILTNDISPNKRIPGEIIFEPLGAGVRVTARDNKHRLLWGYVASAQMLDQIHCLVAVYDTLQELVRNEIVETSPLASDNKEDPIVVANATLSRIEDTIAKLRESLRVKKVSDATRQRARVIARVLSDADRSISLATADLR